MAVTKAPYRVSSRHQYGCSVTFSSGLQTENNNNLSAPPPTTEVDYMEKILTDAFEFLRIGDPVWVKSKNGRYHNIYFPVPLDDNDYTMYYLKKQGIGTRANSSVGFIPFGLFYYNESNDDDEDDPFK